MNEKQYYEGLLDIINKQYNGDATWNDVVDYRESHGVKTSYDYAQRGSAVLMEFFRAGYHLESDDNTREETPDENGIIRSTIKIDGEKNTKSYDDIIELLESDEELTPEKVMQKHNLSPELWEVKTYTDSRSNAWVNGQKKIRYRINLTVKPRGNSIDYESVKKYFQDYKPEYTNNHITRCYPKPDKRRLFVPCFFDLHFARLAHVDEVGEGNGNFDCKIAKKRFVENAQKYIDHIENNKYEKILFIIGQDYFNSEPDGNTANGTKQDNDGRYASVFKEGTAALIDVINMFADLAPVDVVLVQGNHDETVSLYCACVLEAYFRNDENINVDTLPKLRKYYRYGNNLLGLSHGEYEKDRIYGLMQVEAKEDWGETRYHEWILGHLHSDGVTDKNGVLVRRIPSLTGTDYWHYKQGYTMSEKRSVAFVYDYDEGPKEILYEGI